MEIENYDRHKQETDYDYFGWDILNEEPEPDTMCECCNNAGFRKNMYWDKTDNTYYCNIYCFNSYWEV